MITSWLSTLYYLSMAGIALFGLLGLVTLRYYWRHRHDTFPCPEIDDDLLPPVTIQLPIYNERFVVRRIIESALNLDYPKDRLQIQVLDDSTDDTTSIAADLVTSYSQKGFDITLTHRSNRRGFKAGALENGLKQASGIFLAVFDADFQPNPDFLKQTIPHFLEDSDLGMVQTRWSHLNPFESHITGAQTIALDKHFVMEQTVRHRAQLYPKFNGSGGVWRKTCLLEAGGWEEDTVCEDLCLSTRAILKGWKFRFLNEVVAPAELPSTITAYKNQQARWAKGSTQCLVKFGPSILADRRQSLVARIYALLSMAGYSTHLFLLILLLVQVPLIYHNYRPPAWVLLFAIAGIAQPSLFVLGQKELYLDWWQRLRYVPTLLLVAIGLAPANSRAIFQALSGHKNNFVRTPKGNQISHQALSKKQRSMANYLLPVDWIIAIEAFLAVYAAIGLFLCLYSGNLGPAIFMLSCFLGFGYVASAGIIEQRLLAHKAAKSG
jgi:cellulose synthase/poly-beta-1,6-N-acetylglucosamine synthase-like glycosyltransferase